MAFYGPLLWVSLALGLFLLFLGIVAVSIAFAAPLAYYVNLLDVQYWTIDRFGFLPWVRPEREYATAATFTVVFLLAGILLGLLGALLMYLPVLLQP